MAIFKALDTTDLEEFATVLANDLIRRFPPSSEKRTDTGAKNQLDVILKGLGTRAVRYREDHKLGIYGKAKLANVFKWKLRDSGYSDEFVDRVTREIVTHMAVKK